MSSEASGSSDRSRMPSIRKPRSRPASTSLADGQKPLQSQRGPRRTASTSFLPGKVDSSRGRPKQADRRRSASVSSRRPRNESQTSLGSRRRRNVSTSSMGSRHISITSAETYDGCLCCNPYKSVMRYISLFFMCFFGFGSFFCYDNPGALQSQIKQDMDITTTQFASLYAWYSWPNVVLCFLGGYLMDKVFGVRLGGIIFGSLIVIGQSIFALGGVYDMYWLMCVGRFIYGIGGECLQVSQNSYAVLWFKGKELNFVFGMQLSFARLGSTVNFMVMGLVYKYVHHFFRGYECTGATLLAAVIPCVMSLVCAIVLACLESHRMKVIKRDFGDEFEQKDTIRLSDVRYFGATFWMVTCVCVCFYICFMPLIGLGQLFFARKFSLSSSVANSVNGSLYLCSAAASPLFGYIVDKTGRNVTWTMVAALLGVGCHFMLAFTFINPYVGMIGLGLSYSILAASLWPMVALLLPVHQLGTAYGLMQSAQNLGVASMTMVSGYIVDMKGYFILEVFYMIWVAASVLFCVFLWVLDAREGGFLNMSIQERDEEEKQFAADYLEEEDDAEIMSPRDLLVPRTISAIRNKYLARLGAAPPPSHTDVRIQSSVYRHNWR